MLKLIRVNGLDVYIDEENLETVRDMFKEDVTVVDMNDFESKIEKNTAQTFISKARHYLSANDIIQAAEKTWFAAVYAVKELYLSSCGVDINTHNGLRLFCDFAVDCSDIPFWQKFFLRNDCWGSAEKLHQDEYGPGYFHMKEYPNLITNIETFVTTFENMDRAHLYSEFQKEFIAKTDSGVRLTEVSKDMSDCVKLGGNDFKRQYIVHV